MAYMNPDANLQESGYHGNQARIAIGSGGLWGVGLGESTTKMKYLPEPIGDSVFAVIAEELGFIGSATVALLFGTLSLRTLLLSRPRDGDEALSIAETLVRSNAVDLIVVDSAAALAPRREMARRLSESDDRAGAAMIAAGLRDLCGLLRRSRACLLFLNQTRSRPGPGTELSGEGTPGGRSIRLYAAARLEIERVRADAPPGNDPPVLSLRVRIVKNRASAKTRIARLDIPLGKA